MVSRESSVVRLLLASPSHHQTEAFDFSSFQFARVFPFTTSVGSLEITPSNPESRIFFGFHFTAACFEVVFPIDTSLFPAIVSLIFRLFIFHDQCVHLSVPFHHANFETCIATEIPGFVPGSGLRCEAGTTEGFGIQRPKEANIGGVFDRSEIGLRRATPNTIINGCPVGSGCNP